jgi:hypothetical protein
VAVECVGAARAEAVLMSLSTVIVATRSSFGAYGCSRRAVTAEAVLAELPCSMLVVRPDARLAPESRE